MKSRRILGVLSCAQVLSLLLLGCGAADSANDPAGEPGPGAPSVQDEVADAQGDAVAGEISAELRGLFADGKADEVGTLLLTPVQLTSADLANATVTDTGIVFKSPSATVLALKTDDVIASAVEASPFLRRVVAIVRNRAVPSGSATGAVTATTADVPVAAVASDLLTHKTINLPVVDKKITGQVFHEDPAGKTTCKDCFFKIAGVLDFGYKLSGAKLEAFLAKIEGDFDAKMVVIGKYDKPVNFEKIIPLATVDQKFTQHVGPIPIWENVKVKAELKITSKSDGKADLNSGFNASQHFKIETGLQGGKWVFQPTAPSKYTFEEVAINTEGQAATKFSLIITVESAVYSIAGLHLNTSTTSDFDVKICHPPSNWIGNGILAIKAGANLDFLSLHKKGEITLADKTFPFDWAWKNPCQTGASPAPNPGG